jgi:cobalt-precorrin-5B (C1)-methyltransferase
MEEYVCDNGKVLRCGYTTGSCVTAGAVACAKYLLEGVTLERVEVSAPNDRVLSIPIARVEALEDSATSTVIKDGGDDMDVTNGLEIVTRVSLVPHGITILGGVGVGTVTKEGLDRAVGEKAINSTPREMVRKNLENIAIEDGYTGGFEVLVSVPRGESIASKTFNPRLGIVGGISILGTTGIVRPMSDKAILDTIRVELNVKKSSGVSDLVVTLGNYGDFFVRHNLEVSEKQLVQCSNFIGDTLDLANELHFKSVLLVGHIGKLVKLGCGLMNTHSKYGDARMETLSICALQCGATVDVLNEVMSCVTTDNALEVLKRHGLFENTMRVLKDRIYFYLKKRATDSLDVSVIVFSNVHGIL